MLRAKVAFYFLAAAGCAAAQDFVTLPVASQSATVTQRIGLTDITVRYHRPLVNGRKVWGALVPYGQVWRAGANENTTIEFSSPVTVEGQALPKGVYGLHTIPGTDSWVVAFSKMSTAWGSFSYKQEEDALRVTVKPQPAEMHEALTYDFDDPKPDSVAVTLRWEKLAVPFHVSANETEVTLASLRNELRGGVQYTWEGFAQAANYCSTKNVALEEGLGWANRSIQVEERFDNLSIKAELQRKLHRDSDAAATWNKALSIGTAQQVYFAGRQMQSVGNQQLAMEIFRTTAKRFPEHWLAHLALARVASSTGDFATALKEIKAVQGNPEVPDVQKPNLANLVKRLENKEDINK